MLDTRGRLIIASNRLIDPEKPAAGGLAVALGEMMRNIDGLWIGAKQKEAHEAGSQGVQIKWHGRTQLVQVELSQQHRDKYYAGFSNSVLWPIFHEKAKRADLEPAHSYFEAYKEVNKMFASQLLLRLKDNDVLWIHDYHLILLAQELRALGGKHRMGFFNHIPLPPPDVIRQIPQHKQLMEALFSYDLVGMQSPKDVENLRLYVEEEGAGQQLPGSFVAAFGKKASVQSFPIGIDVDAFNALESNSDSSQDSQTILEAVRKESRERRTLMIGVDRLDYTKGIPKRLQAFRELLEKHDSALRNKVTFVQIAAPTRGGRAYEKLREKTEKLVNAINKDFGTDKWMPVMYFYKSVDRNALRELYRLSRVGVVTPVADGMNLVAKEYIAAQDPEDPGVLVLSRKAGAAFQLGESLLVSPKNRADIVEAYETALSMTETERREKHAALLPIVKTQDLRGWRENYLAALYSVPSSSVEDQQRAVIRASTSGTERDEGTSSQAASFGEEEQGASSR